VAALRYGASDLTPSKSKGVRSETPPLHSTTKNQKQKVKVKINTAGGHPLHPGPGCRQQGPPRAQATGGPLTRAAETPAANAAPGHGAAYRGRLTCQPVNVKEAAPLPGRPPW
jgi:hypothetical protein